MQIKKLIDWVSTTQTPSRGGSRNLFGGGQTKVLNRILRGIEARIEVRSARVSRGSPRIEGEARTEGEAREKSGGGVWGGGSVSPSPEQFWKLKLETIYFGAYLKQLFEMTNEMV